MLTNQPIRVLLIEDNPGDARLIREFLCTRDTADFTLSVVGALADATQDGLSACDVVLLDLSLPDSVGLDTFVGLTERGIKAPVVVLTGLEDEDLALRAVQLGAEDILYKTDLDGNHLERSLRYAIERHHLRELSRLQKAEIERSEQRFRGMADLLPDMLFECDSELNLLYLNHAVKTTLGYDEDDLRGGLHLSALLGTVPYKQVRQQLVGTSTADQTSVGTCDVLSRNGDSVACEIRATTVVGPDAKIVGYRGAIRDVTERQKAEEAQRLAAMGQLAAGVAHEFNNILGAMSGWAQLTQSDGRPEFWEKLATTVQAATLRGSEICKDLMTYARPQELKREPLHISGPIDAALSMAMREIENSEVTVLREIDGAAPRILGDWSQLQQVFLNLFINACHAMPEGGTLAISASVTGGDEDLGDVVVRVTDSGIGIPPENLSRVFEPFFTTKRELGSGQRSGTGLGLYVSRGIIQAHGGSLNVRSGQGTGTTFEIRLSPHEEASYRETVEVEAAGTASLSSPGSQRVVLVADDEADIREFVGYVLREQGMQVLEAESAIQAAEMLERKAPALVITDLLMPGGGAKCVVQTARRLPEPPAVIIITGTGADFLETRLAELGHPPCIRKPIEIPELLATVATVLDGEPALT